MRHQQQLTHIPVLLCVLLCAAGNVPLTFSISSLLGLGGTKWVGAGSVSLPCKENINQFVQNTPYQSVLKQLK